MSQDSIVRAKNQELLKKTFNPDLGNAKATLKSRTTAINSALGRFKKKHGYEPDLMDLVREPQELAKLFRCDEKMDGTGKLGSPSMKNLRLSIKRLVDSIRVPADTTRNQLRESVILGWRMTTEQRGVRYNVGVGIDRKPNLKRVPTVDEIVNVIDVIRGSEIEHIRTYADLTAFMLLTGARLGAALSLTKSDVHVLPNKSVWVYVHEKSRRHDRPVYVSSSSNQLVESWLTGSKTASLWADGEWAPSDYMFRYHLNSFAPKAGVEPFSPHDIRRSFATHVHEHLGFGKMVKAGGWKASTIAERYIDRAYESRSL